VRLAGKWRHWRRIPAKYAVIKLDINTSVLEWTAAVIRAGSDWRSAGKKGRGLIQGGEVDRG